LQKPGDWPMWQAVFHLNTWLGPQRLTFQVRKLSVENIAPVYVIYREDMFDRPHLYGNADGDYYDNANPPSVKDISLKTTTSDS
jgi:hypothetical protein